jgi:hypothetical protein
VFSAEAQAPPTAIAPYWLCLISLWYYSPWNFARRITGREPAAVLSKRCRRGSVEPSTDFQNIVVSGRRLLAADHLSSCVDRFASGNWQRFVPDDRGAECRGEHGADQYAALLVATQGDAQPSGTI